MQQQYWPLADLAKRDIAPPPPVAPEPVPDEFVDAQFEEAALVGLVTKQLAELQAA